jgi:hypothetical protein
MEDDLSKNERRERADWFLDAFSLCERLEDEFNVLCLAGEARNVSLESLNLMEDIFKTTNQCDLRELQNNSINPYYMYRRSSANMRKNRTFLQCMDAKSRKMVKSRNQDYCAVASWDCYIPTRDWSMELFDYLRYLLMFCWRVDVIEGLIPFSVYNYFQIIFWFTQKYLCSCMLTLTETTQKDIEDLTRDFTLEILRDVPELTQAQVQIVTENYNSMLIYALDYAAIIHGLIRVSPVTPWICDWFDEEKWC